MIMILHFLAFCDTFYSIVKLQSRVPVTNNIAGVMIDAGRGIIFLAANRIFDLNNRGSLRLTGRITCENDEIVLLTSLNETFFGVHEREMELQYLY